MGSGDGEQKQIQHHASNRTRRLTALTEGLNDTVPIKGKCNFMFTFNPTEVWYNWTDHQSITGSHYKVDNLVHIQCTWATQCHQVTHGKTQEEQETVHRQELGLLEDWNPSRFSCKASVSLLLIILYFNF